MGLPTSIRMASPVRIRPAVPVFSSPAQVHASNPVLPVQIKERSFRPSMLVEAPGAVKETADKKVPVQSPPVQIKVDALAAVRSPPVQVELDTPGTVPSPPLQVKDVQSATDVSEESISKRDEMAKEAAIESLKQLEIQR